MESLIRESDLRRMVIKMREKETCMETVTAAYVPTDEDFRLKSNAGEIGIDTNFASQNFWKDVLIRFLRKKCSHRTDLYRADHRNGHYRTGNDTVYLLRAEPEPEEFSTACRFFGKTGHF